MQRKFTRYPRTITRLGTFCSSKSDKSESSTILCSSASSKSNGAHDQDVLEFLSKRDITKLMNKIEGMCNILYDASYYVAEYNDGDDFYAKEGECSPNSIYHSLMDSYDSWEYEDDLIHVRDLLWDPHNKFLQDWVYSKIQEIFVKEAPEYKDGEEWLNILRQYGHIN